MAASLPKVRIVGGVRKLSLEIDGKEIQGLRSVEFRASCDDVPEITATFMASEVELEIDEEAQQVEDALRSGGVRAQVHRGVQSKITIPIEVTVTGPDKMATGAAARQVLRELKDEDKDP